MPSLAPYIEDPRFEKLDRVGKAKAREQLFLAFLEGEPDMREVFVEAPDDKQVEMFSRFVQRVTKLHPEAFATTIEGPARRTMQETHDEFGSGQPVSMPTGPPVPTKIPVPILDAASEAKIAQVVDGARTGKAPDWEDWSVDDFARLGPYLDVLAPGHAGRSIAQEKAKEAAQELKIKPESQAATLRREAAQGLLSPVVQAEKLLRNRLPKSLTGDTERTDKVQKIQEVNSWVVGADGGVEAAGAVAGLVAGGIGAAKALAGTRGGAGLKFFSKRNLAKLAAADAALGAAYAESAPGFLANKVDEWSGEQNKTRRAVLTALEAAGFSGVVTGVTRASVLKRFARENLGWTGRTMGDLREFVEGEAFRRAKVAETAGGGGQSSVSSDQLSVGRQGAPSPAGDVAPASAQGSGAVRPPAEAGRRSGPRLGSRADGEYDLLDAIEEEGGIRARGSVENPPGEYDGQTEAFGGAARMLLRRNGVRPDLLLEQIRHRGYNFESIGEMYEAVRSAVASREAVKKQIGQEKLDEQFYAAALENKRTGADGLAEQVSAQELNLGDTLTIRGQPFEVVDIDEATGAPTVRSTQDTDRWPGPYKLPEDGSVFIDRDSLVRMERELEPTEAFAAGAEAFAGGGAARTQGPALREQAAAPVDPNTHGFNVEPPENSFTTWGKDVVVALGNLESVRVVETPEMVRIVRELTGSAPKIRKLPKSLGVFSTGAGVVKLSPKIFRNPALAARVLGHELFHLVDWLPEKTLGRGNVLGRLGVLRKFMGTSLDIHSSVLGGAEEIRAGQPRGMSRMITTADRAQMRKEAYAATKQKLGPRPLKEKFPEQHKEWTAAMNARYGELVAEQVEARGLATKDAVREELIGVSDFWRPFLDQAAAGTVPAKYVEYRSSAEELYADFGSVLLNDPAALKARAPKAWAMFWNYLDRKPEVKRTLFEVQELLTGGPNAKLARRRADILAGFAQGEEVFLRKMAERREAGRSFRGWSNRLRQQVQDVFAPVTQRAREIGKKTGDPGAKAIEWLLDEHPLAMETRNYQLLQDLYEGVVKPIDAAGLSVDDVGELLLLRRIAGPKLAPDPPTPEATARQAPAAPEGTRTGLANPWGHTPESAAEQIAYLQQLHGPEKWAQIEAAAAAFDALMWPIVEEAVALGSYSRESFETIILPNRGTYAAFAVVEHLQDHVPAAIIRQQGTLSAVANPFLVTTLKLASLNRLNQWQKVKRGVVGFMQEHFPEEIAVAERHWTGRGFEVRPNRERGGGTVELLEDGQRAGYYVPEEVEKMFEGVTPARASAIVEVLNFGFRKLFYPLFITYNPVFQLATSPIRDIRRTIRNTGFRNGLRQVGEYVANLGTLSVETANVPLRAMGLPPFPVPMTETARQVRAYLRSQPDDLIRKMMAEGATSSPIDAFTTGGVGPESFEELLRRFSVLPDKDKPFYLRARVLEPVWKLLRGIEYSGLTMEFLPKVGTYKYLTAKNSMDPREVAEVVRNNVGVPNFRRSGTHTRIIGTLFPFFNVFMQGLRDDFRLAAGAKTRAGWWFRWAAGSGGMRMLQAAGAAGLLGASIKEFYDFISEYDKTNYLVIPLGWADGGDFGKRVVRVRIPEDEVDRLLGGIMHKAVQGLTGAEAGQWSQLLGFAGGQVPGINPAVEIPVAWGTWLSGYNPIDGFRAQPVLSNSEWLAGGWPAIKGMSSWTLQQTGVTNFVRWDPNAETWMETAVSATPGVNRLIGVTDYGARERQDAIEKAEDVKRAKLRTKQAELVQNLAGEYGFLRTIKVENRTPQQLARWQVLSSWHNRIYKPMEERMLLMEEAGLDTRALREQLALASEAFER